MDEQLNEQEVDEAIEEETPETELTSETDWEAEAKKARGIAQRLRTKLIKATEAKKAEVKVEPKVEPVKEVQNTGELDETQLNFLELKGISDEDQIDIIQKVMKKTGQSLRQVLKDEYVQSKLETIKRQKEVKEATPSATKRTGAGASDNIDLLYQKFEQTGELPTDFELRKKVIDRKAAKNDPSLPPWRR